MPPSQIIAFSPMNMSGGQPNGKQRAVVPLNTLNTDTMAQEEYTELPVREAGVFDRGYAYLDTNTLDGVSSLTVRKSRSDTAITIPVGAGQVGPFGDWANSAAVLASDAVNWKSVTGGTIGGMNAIALALRFNPTNPDLTVSWPWAGGSGGGISANFETQYLPVSGTISADVNPENAYGKIHGHFDWRDLCFQIANNPRLTPVTVRSFINGAFGNQIVTIPPGFRGVLSDPVNADTLKPGDFFCYAITTLGGGGNLNTRRVSSTLRSASRQWLYSAANVNGATFNSGGNRYVPFAGNLANAVATEAVAQIPLFAQSVSKIAAFVSANNYSRTVTARVRINGTPGTVAVSFAPGQIGWQENLIATDAIPDWALGNFEIEIPPGTGKITFRSITLLGETAASEPGQPGTIRFAAGVR